MGRAILWRLEKDRFVGVFFLRPLGAHLHHELGESLGVSILFRHFHTGVRVGEVLPQLVDDLIDSLHQEATNICSVKQRHLPTIVVPNLRPQSLEFCRERGGTQLHSFQHVLAIGLVCLGATSFEFLAAVCGREFARQLRKRCGNDLFFLRSERGDNFAFQFGGL